MEGAESKLQMRQLSSSELYKILVDVIDQEFEDVLEEIEDDETFSEMTAKSYDFKKSYLIRHCIVLLNLLRSLAKQHYLLIEEVINKCRPSSSSGTESPAQQKDGPSGSRMYKIYAEIIEGKLKEILQKLEEDESFSEMTAESYDEKKSYLRTRLTKLSCFHRLMDKKHVRLIEQVSKNCPSLIKNQHIDSSGSSSRQPIQILTCSSSGTNKLPGSPVKDYVVKVKETKPVSDKKLKKIRKIEKYQRKLQKHLADLKLVVSESDNRMHTMEEELETSRKTLLIAKDTSEMFQQIQKLERDLQMLGDLLGVAHKHLLTQQAYYQKLKSDMKSRVAEIAVRDDKIQELNTKSDWYESEMSKLKETLESKECIWSNDVAKLKGQLKDQTELLEDLKERFNGVSSDKNRISGELERLKDERCSQDKLIKELQTRLNTLQVEQEWVVLSSDNAEKLKRQEEVIAGTKE